MESPFGELNCRVNRWNLLRVPLLNANEEEVVIVDVVVGEGDHVKRGDLICVLESTKATSDVEAPIDGYVRNLGIAATQRVRVGDMICAVTDSSDAPLDLGSTEARPATQLEVEATQKARELAAKHHIDLNSLAHGGIITAQDVRQAMQSTSDVRQEPSTAMRVHPGDMAILGAGGHARALVELVRASRPDVQIVAAVDDAPSPPKDVLGVPVIGDSVQLEELRERGVRNAGLGIGAVTDNQQRIEHFDRLRGLGFTIPSFCHPRASVEPSVTMGQGNQIFAGAVIGSCVRLGDNTIINSGSVLSHDCQIGSHTHIAPGAILAGGVNVGQNTLVGMGVTVYLGVTIGDNVVIANGVHVLHDVPDGTTLRASH